uniref:Uncharacterized protein n=1 Tax=Periophthalmus magnuspinnatus TaxID=409849 RepID=A0A3B4B673_9GOBI
KGSMVRVGEMDIEGRTALILAAQEEGRLEMSTLLLEKGGVPLESKDAEGRTALHVACWQGSVEMVNLLLKYSANPNAQDSEGRPPLHSIAWTGHTQVGRKLLETPGIDIDLCCNQGATALSIAAQEGNVNIVAMLLDKGANPEHVDKYNRTPVKPVAHKVVYIFSFCSMFSMFLGLI